MLQLDAARCDHVQHAPSMGNSVAHANLVGQVQVSLLRACAAPRLVRIAADAAAGVGDCLTNAVTILT